MNSVPSQRDYKDFEFYIWPVIKGDSLTEGKVLMNETSAFEPCLSEHTELGLFCILITYSFYCISALLMHCGLFGEF